jgi:hypothetical protein
MADPILLIPREALEHAGEKEKHEVCFVIARKLQSG